MVQVAKLSADLFANTARFETGMKRAGKSFNGFSKTVEKGSKATAKAIGVVTAALGVLTVKQSRVIDETAKLSAALGVNIREFQALALVTSEAGISQDQLGNIITKSQRSIVEAARGLQTYKRSFDTLNLSAEDLLRLSPDEQFIKIATALENVENDTLRTATALEIFGRSGRQVINALGDIGAKADEARAFNDKFGVSLNAIDARKVEEANDTFARLGQAISGLGNILAVQIAPIITAISNSFLESGVDANTFGISIQNAMILAAKGVDILRHAVLGFNLVFTKIVANVTELTALMSLGFFDLGNAIATTFSKIPGVSLEAEDAILDIGLAARKTADEANAALPGIIKQMKEFETTASKIEDIQLGAALRSIQAGNEAVKAGAQEITGLLGDQETATKKLSDVEKERISNAKELGLTFTSAFEKAIEGGEKFSGVLQGLAKDIQKILIRRTITEPLGDFVTGVAQGGGGDIGNIIGSLFSSLPSFGVGTNNVPRDTIAQIHKGEMIVPAFDAQKLREGGGGSGGGVTVMVNNNTPSNVTTSAQESGNGTELTVMIDQAVAKNINKPGSLTQQALRGQQSRTLVRR